MSTLLVDATPGPLKYRLCGNCGKDLAEQQVQRRECQSNQWPIHKRSFHVEKSSDLSTDEIEAAVRELKYPSAKSLSKTFSDYLEAHSWAISALIKTDSILHYGHTFEDHKPHHVLCLRFKCRREFSVDTAQERDRRPHCAFFLLRSNRFRNLSDWLTAPGDMERIGGRYTRDMRKAHKYYLSRGDPSYLGVLGVSLVIDGLPILHYDFVPQYLPRAPSPRPPKLSFMEERRIFEDFLILCIGSLDFEFVFRCTEDEPDGAGVAIPGPLVKEDGKWKWRPFFRTWAQYEPRLVPNVEKLLREMETKRSPKYMMELFHSRVVKPKSTLNDLKSLTGEGLDTRTLRIASQLSHGVRGRRAIPAWLQEGIDDGSFGRPGARSTDNGVYTFPGPLKFRACRCCGKDLSGQPVKRCARCFAAPAYCGRECQSKDWPIHKTSYHVDRNGDLSTDEIEAAARKVKYPSASALSKTFSDYLEAHSWAMSALIKTDSILEYEHTFQGHTPRRVLCYRLECRAAFSSDSAPERDRRPHCAFALRFIDLADWLGSPGDMERIGGRYTHDMQKADEYYLSRGDPAYLAVLGPSSAIGGLPILH
ncbi:hypothetical protein K466DRAFT_652480 [Polyporus arcularius HHB13444]|uniref:MYND-type domain-containing protein n=1 Tax=Polyporus arcularius HHB13444 TaxID=1314778 RepID=A0A5C3PGM9_9APHY|nr:hypothetical protein K466DRAFT_652480 [Polyporus arcularius HHB13444]